MKEQKKSKKQMSTAKKVICGLLGIALIVGATIAGTLAFLTATTDEKSNTFTASQDIKLGLDEPNWNLDDDGDPEDPSKPDPSNCQPGTKYDKDPILYNITGKQGNDFPEEWVAMRVDYYITPAGGTKTLVTYENITTDDKAKGYDANNKAGVIDAISFDDSWIKITNSECTSMPSDAKYDIYVYKYKLTAEDGVASVPLANNITEKVATSGSSGFMTTSLFKADNATTGQQIKIKSQDQLILNGYSKTGGLLDMPSFEIKVKGGAIKNQGDINISAVDLTSADNAIKKPSEEIVKGLVELLKDKPTNP